MTAPEFKVGDLVDWTPHHPALPTPPHAFKVVRVIPAAGHLEHAYWCAPHVPPKVRTLRNGRTVEEFPNWEALIGESSLRLHEVAVAA